MPDLIPADPTATILDPITGDVPTSPLSLPSVAAAEPAPLIPAVVPEAPADPLQQALAAPEPIAPSYDMAEQGIPQSSEPPSSMVTSISGPTDTSAKADEAWTKRLQDNLDARITGESPDVQGMSTEHHQMLVNDAAIQRMTDFAPDAITVEDEQRDILRAQVADTYFEGKGKDSEAEFYDQVKLRWDKDKAVGRVQENVNTSAWHAAIKTAAGEGVDRQSAFKDFVAAQGKDIDHLDPLDQGQLYSRFSSAFSESTMALGFKKELTGLWGALKSRALVSGEIGGGDGVVSDIGQLSAVESPSEAAFKAYSTLPPEQRGDFLKALNTMIDLVPAEKREGFFAMLEENLLTSPSSTIEAGKSGFMATMLQASAEMPGGRFGPISGASTPNSPQEDARALKSSELQQQSRDKADFISDVRKAYSSKYSPVELTWGSKDSMLRNIESGLLAAPEAISTTAVAAIPYLGMPMMASVVRGKLYESYRSDLIDQGMDPLKASQIADIIAPIAAVPEMLMEKLQLKIAGGAVTKLLPAFSKSLAATVAKFPGLVRGTGAGVAAAFAEATTETAQDYSQAAVRDSFDYFMETFAGQAKDVIPDYEWTKTGGLATWDGFRTSFIQNFAAVGAMGVIAGLKEGRKISKDDLSQAMDDVNSAADKVNARNDIFSGAITGGTTNTVTHDPIIGGYVFQGGESTLKTGEPDVLPGDAAIHAWVQQVNPNIQSATFGVGFGSRAGTVQYDKEAQEAFDSSLYHVVRQLSIHDPSAVFEVSPSDTVAVDENTGISTHVVNQAAEDSIDPATSVWVTGWSQTTFDENGGRATTNKLVNGSSAITAFHEFGHGARRAALAAGKLTRDEEIRFYRALDSVLSRGSAHREASFLPDGVADADLTDSHLGEAFSGLLEAEAALAGRQAHQALNPKEMLPVPGTAKRLQAVADTKAEVLKPALSLLARNLQALLRLAPTATSKMRAMLNAINANFALAARRAFRIKKALKDGTLNRDEINAYINKVTGAAQSQEAAKVKSEVHANEFAKSKVPVQRKDESAPAHAVRVGKHTQARSNRLLAITQSDSPTADDMALITTINSELEAPLSRDNSPSDSAFAKAVADAWATTADADVTAAIGNVLDKATNKRIAMTNWTRHLQELLGKFAALPAKDSADRAAAAEAIRVEAMAAAADLTRQAEELATTFEARVKVEAEEQGLSDFHRDRLERLVQEQLAAEIEELEKASLFAEQIAGFATSAPGVSAVYDKAMLVQGLGYEASLSTTENKAASAHSMKKMIDDRFILRKQLINSATKGAGIDGAEKRAADVLSKQNTRGQKLKNAVNDLRSFAGALRAAFGYDSRVAEDMINGIAEAELNESEDKSTVYRALRDMLNGTARYNSKFDRSEYKAAKLTLDLNEVVQDGKKPGVGITATRQVTKISKEKLTQRYSQMQAVHALMMFKQPEGRSKLLAHGYDQAFMDELEAGLSKEARVVQKWLADQYEASYNKINSFYKSRYGFDLKKVPNYCPLTVIPDTTLVKDNDPVTGAARSRKGGFTPSSLITRHQNTVAKPDLSRSALDVFQAHTEQTMHWIHFANISELMVATLKDSKVQLAISSEAGAAVANHVAQWADHYYDRGNANALARLEFHELSRWAQSNMQAAILVGRMGTLMIQSMNVLAAAVKLGPGAFLRGALHVVSHPGLLKEAWNSRFIRQRTEMGDTAIQEIKAASRSKKKPMLDWAGDPIGRLHNQVMGIGGDAISKTDSVFSSVAYAIVYDRHFRIEKNSSEKAHRLTVNDLDQLLQPTRESQRSLLEIDTNSPWMKAVWAFSSEPRQKLSYLSDRVLLNVEGNTPLERARNRAATLAYAYFGYGAVQAMIRAVWSDLRDDDDREWIDDKHYDWLSMMLDATLWPLDGLPLVGGELKSGVKTATQKSARMAGLDVNAPTFLSSSPLLGSVSKSFNAVVKLSDWGRLDGQEREKAIEAVAMGIAPLGGIGAASSGIMHLVRDFHSLVKNFADD